MFFETADRDETAPCPSLVILDINLPRRNGQEVVYQMRQSRRCAAAPVVVVTSSDSERDRDEMKKLGVEHYFRKPSEYGEFMKLGDLVREVLRESGGGD
jgi:two-component system, chemotaxis family, response regulator Rcp1